ncbi:MULTISPECIES: YitT family protein [unclassified Brucella]|uniref:YitT family protein n=1 Tax=unclassified Brucella TaxID=2632610 RepID=UPI0012ADC860|nr:MULTISPECIES: YitT family protein [unclassified Brucella]MRN42589.1 YitT family protein [Brucella sp. 09RB8913]MRN59900.1 YitT family protein [Brucella sp. 09RB8918]
MRSGSGEDGIFGTALFRCFTHYPTQSRFALLLEMLWSLKLADIADSAPPLADASSPISVDRHRLYEDAIAMLIGTSFIALGITLYSHAMLMTGSTAGIALLIHYATGTGFGILYFLINLPFYYFAVRRMGWAFTIRTFAAVALLSGFTRLMPLNVDFTSINPLFAALMGGTLMGMGVLALFRHRSGVGGVNILALYLQDAYGIRAGWFQLGLDVLIMLASLFFIPWENMVLSLVGAVAMNVIIAINHKPGRYIGIS